MCYNMFYRGIRLTLVNAISSGTHSLPSSPNILSFRRTNINCLLNKTVKQQAARARGSAIKTKYKLIKIIVQMRRSYRSLMRSLQPSFQKRNHPISQRQQIFTNISCFTNNRMFVTKIR